jgi:hypothetical protein
MNTKIPHNFLFEGIKDDTQLDDLHRYPAYQNIVKYQKFAEGGEKIFYDKDRDRFKPLINDENLGRFHTFQRANRSRNALTYDEEIEDPLVTFQEINMDSLKLNEFPLLYMKKPNAYDFKITQKIPQLLFHSQDVRDYEDRVAHASRAAFVNKPQYGGENNTWHDDDLQYGGENNTWHDDDLQYGGGTTIFFLKKILNDSGMLDELINKTLKDSLTNSKLKEKVVFIFRSVTKSVGAVAASTVTAGIGGDTVVESVFAVQSTSELVIIIRKIAKFTQVSKIIKMFGEINITGASPFVIYDQYNLKNGWTNFNANVDAKLDEIFSNEKSKKLIEEGNQEFIKLLKKIITPISDWIGCLFPDSQGVVSALVQDFLLKILTEYPFDLVEQIIYYLPKSAIEMIANPGIMSLRIRKVIAIVKVFLSSDNVNKIDFNKLSKDLVCAFVKKSTGVIKKKIISKLEKGDPGTSNLFVGSVKKTVIASIKTSDETINKLLCDQTDMIIETLYETLGRTLGQMKNANKLVPIIFNFMNDHMDQKTIERACLIFHNVFPLFLILLKIIQRENRKPLITLPGIEHERN